MFRLPISHTFEQFTGVHEPINRLKEAYPGVPYPTAKPDSIDYDINTPVPLSETALPVPLSTSRRIVGEPKMTATFAHFWIAY